MRKAKIISIEKVGLKNCMDLEVDSEDHIFYGNNIVVSNSHSVSYAVNSYLSAWHKANYTKEFFLSYLYYASDKQDPLQEVYELVSEAKLFDIETRIPNLSFYTEKFSWHNNCIYFGLKDIKSLSGVNGDKVFAAIQELEKELGKPSKDFTWMDVLILLSSKVNSTVFKTLASVGFFSTKITNISRNRALYQYIILKELTATEINWVVENYPKKKWNNLVECFTDLAPTKKEGGGTSKKDRSEIIKNEIYLLENPPYSLDDDPYWIVDQEVKFLGCPISLSRIDSSDSSAANTTCKEILNGKTGEHICVAASVNKINNHKVKKGKTQGEIMSFLTIEDETCSLDSVICFPETRKTFEHLLYQGNNLLFCGKVEKKDNSFIIDKIHEI
jgi:DNA polymerase III alpha subunit